MKTAIMQPTYLPWLGYFDLMDQVDLFVILDNVQFVKQSWQQRNRIKTPKGLEWMTLPVLHQGRFGQLIKDVEISEPNFWKKHTRSLEVNYGKARHFGFYFPNLMSFFERGEPWRCLGDLNISLIEWLSGTLGLKTPVVRASTLDVDGKRSSLIAEICSLVKADEYLSPIGSADYLLKEIDEFTKREIKVFFQNYSHPTYTQRFKTFLPFASVIDLIFNEGPRSIGIIRDGRGEPYLPGALPQETCGPDSGELG
jgi:hypothetical protein